MFLTILEESGKLTKLCSELTMRTRHVKLPVGETFFPQFNSCDFKSLPLRLIIVIVKQTFRRHWSLLNSKGRLYRSALEEYQYLWFQRPFLPKTKKYLSAQTTTSNPKRLITKTKLK